MRSIDHHNHYMHTTFLSKLNQVFLRALGNNLLDLEISLQSATASQKPSKIKQQRKNNEGSRIAGSLEVGECTCFFNLATTNRSKSESPLLFSLTAIFFACRVSPNFFSTSAAVHFLATVAVRAPRGNLGRTTGRRLIWDNWMT
jgi:hypothetical protein